MPFDFDHAVQAPFRMQPGLRRLAPGSTQLTPLQPGSRHHREKRAVLSAFAGQALLQAPGFDAAPALAALCAHAATEHPGAWAWDGQRAVAAWLGLAVTLAGQLEARPGANSEAERCLAALDSAWRLPGLLSLAFAEDFAIVDGDSGHIPWLAVALPSHWAPEHKVGRHFAEVHAPVADNSLLVAASAALTRMVTGAERWERFVWTVTPHPRLHAHPQRVDEGRWQGLTMEQAWWRTEHQSFIPLPERRQAVFTIHVELQPLAEAVATPPRAARLHDAVASMSDAVLAYRGLKPVRDTLLAWLAARSEAR